MAAVSVEQICLQWLLQLCTVQTLCEFMSALTIQDATLNVNTNKAGTHTMADRRHLAMAQPMDFDADFCDGAYTHQRSRKERCSLTEIGVLYWKYIPSLLKWKNDIDLVPCPLNFTYQLVRNLLAACVRPNGMVAPERGSTDCGTSTRGCATMVPS